MVKISHSIKALFIGLLLLSPASFGSNVLFFGDSQSAGYFGKKLDLLLRQSHVVETYTACGSIGGSWISPRKINCSGSWGKDKQGRYVEMRSTKPIGKIVDQFIPQYVIFQFGGNYRKMSEDEISLDIEKLLTVIKKNDAKCFFVTGPDTRSERELLPDTVASLEKAINGRCEFFNTLEVDEIRYPEQGGDGYHYYNFLGAEDMTNLWAQSVYEKFNEMEGSNSISTQKN